MFYMRIVEYNKGVNHYTVSYTLLFLHVGLNRLIANKCPYGTNLKKKKILLNVNSLAKMA